MNEEFELLESQQQPLFDIKAFLFRALSYWYLMVLCIGIGWVISYQLNIRKQYSYRLSNKISIEDDKNPLFTSNTSLTFNWGGVTGKVQTMIVSLKSRSHNEKVVENLKFYLRYLKEGRFRMADIYLSAPFRMEPTYDFAQLSGKIIKIHFLSENEYRIEIEFPSSIVSTQNYKTKKKGKVDVTPGIFTKTYKVGEKIELPFLSGTIEIPENRKVKNGDVYFIQFLNFDGVVDSYKNKIQVKNIKGSPILDLSLTDVNKGKIVDFLNETVKVLSEDQLDRKNQFATNTINFIDEQLSKVKDQLQTNADELNSYRKKNKIFNLNEESINLSTKLSDFDLEKDEINRKISYYSNLKKYLENSKSFTDIPAPAIAGIDDGNILSNVSKINDLSVQKSKLEYSVRSDASIFNDLERQIDGLKAVLIENISASTSVLKSELENVNTKLSKAESQFSRLPEDQQRLLSIERQYNLSEQT